MKKIISLMLAIMLAFSLTACNQLKGPENSGTDLQSQPSYENLDRELEIRISVLSGTTGMGIAPLMKSALEGHEPLNYKIEVANAADQIAPKIIQGATDIAAVPTNLAATLYNKTKGQIKILCANTKGVLYLLSSDPTVTSISDLKGKTVHVPGQGTNPEYLLRHVLEGNGLTVGTDVTFDYTYNNPDMLMTATAGTDSVKIALLPEPKATVACDANKNLKSVVDITEEWNKLNPDAPLYQGCIIVRKAFLEEHPNEVNEFLKKYEQSINEVNKSQKQAAEDIASLGIIAEKSNPDDIKALIERTIPRCNLCFVQGRELESALSRLYNVLYEISPSAVGGNVPDSGIFFK